ncbi:hypothetical protein EJ02DRAFT_51219 [Clathrospora elynae]|uniref:Uncharacterized protein n=1 Tax=Clathrospora elynae TaxID=706981 RepID=A0A6A5SZX6_9PLEO|nr:hypothetical protein EJ02DRAFT_51219 [Clathrospora elynae]
MFLLTLLAGSTLALSTTAHPNTTCPPLHGAKGVRVRFPPSFNTSHHFHEPVWPAPPVGWYFKPWSMIYASNPQYAAFRNLQYDPTAINPANLTGPVNDLFSFQLPGNDTVITTYGVDTPHPLYAAVLEYAGTGILVGASSEYTLLAWGCDSKGTPYYVSYSSATNLTKTPAGIDMMSTSDKGPDNGTVSAVVKELKGLGNKEITGLVDNFTRMVQDGKRVGRNATCDEYCQSNQDLISVLG